MQERLVNKLLDVAVKSPAFNQFKVEIGRVFENRFLPRLAGDYGEDRHLNLISQPSKHQRLIH